MIFKSELDWVGYQKRIWVPSGYQVYVGPCPQKHPNLGALVDLATKSV